MDTNRILIFLLALLLPLSVLADRTENRPVTFDTGSSLTIKTGIVVDFQAGSIVDFTGATVTGLAGGGGAGTVTSFVFTDSTGIDGTVSTATTVPTLSLALTSAAVGLGNVTNTSDANKPVSTAQQTALDLKANDSAVVHKTGNETVAGVKTLSSAPIITPATASRPAWIGSSKEVRSGVAGTDFVEIGGTPDIGDVVTVIDDFPLTVQYAPQVSAIAWGAISGTIGDQTDLQTALGTKQASDADLATWAGVTPGTGVAAALAINIGSAGAPVLFNGAGGTPSSLTGTNITGIPPAGVTGTAAILGANTFTGAQTNSTTGAASAPAEKLTGVPFAGTGTTSFPLLYINDANATASTTLNTSGTYLGVNGDGTQDLMNLLKDGASQFKLDSAGLARFGPTGAATSFFQISRGGVSNLSYLEFFKPDSTRAGYLGFDASPYTTLTLNTFTTLALANAGITMAGPIITTPQALSGAGAVNLTTSATAYTSGAGPDALTLANGTAGQIKTVAHVVDGGSGVLTPTTRGGYQFITFTNVGDSVTLQYFTTAGWCVVGIYGAVVTP